MHGSGGDDETAAARTTHVLNFMDGLSSCCGEVHDKNEWLNKITHTDEFGFLDKVAVVPLLDLEEVMKTSPP